MLYSETIHLAFHCAKCTLVAEKQRSYELDHLNFIFIASLKIADRFNELSQEYFKSNNSEEYATIANMYIPQMVTSIAKTKQVDIAKAYSRMVKQEDIVYCEKHILNILKFDLLLDTILSNIQVYAKLMEFSLDSIYYRYASMLADACLYYNSFDRHSRKVIAQGIWLVTTFRIHGSSYRMKV